MRRKQRRVLSAGNPPCWFYVDAASGHSTASFFRIHHYITIYYNSLSPVWKEFFAGFSYFSYILVLLPIL